MIAERSARTPPLHELYFGMCDRWIDIKRQSGPTAAKQEACLALLVDLIDRIAAARVGQVDAPLRFFADMTALKWHLLFRFDGELDLIARWPGFRLVSDWLLDNALADRTKSAGPIDITRYMDRR